MLFQAYSDVTEETDIDEEGKFIHYEKIFICKEY